MWRSRWRSRENGVQFGRLRCGSAVAVFGHPRGCRIFPLVVGQLAYVSAIPAHDKQFAIRLRNSVHQFCLVFETHARTTEDNLLSVRKTHAMCVVARGIRQEE